MSKFGKLKERILSGQADKNFDFGDLCNFLETLGFENRIQGSYHIYFKKGVKEIINLQSLYGKAKPYQVKQVRNILLNNHLI